MKKIYCFIICLVVLFICKGVALSNDYILITSPYIPHENWHLGSTQYIEWEEHTEGDTIGAFRIILKQNGQEKCVIRSSYKKLDAIPVSGFFLMEDGFRWKFQWNKAGYCENNVVVEVGEYQIGLQSTDPNVHGTQVSPPFSITYAAEKIPEGLKNASASSYDKLSKGGKTVAKSPDLSLDKSIENFLASKPVAGKKDYDKAYAPPKIKMPYPGQVFKDPQASEEVMIPFHYRVSFQDPFDITVRFRKYEIPSSTLPQLADQDPKPTGTWSTLLEKTIPADQLTTEGSADGSYIFTELLYMPQGSYRIDAKARLSSTVSTPWGKTVMFHLHGAMAPEMLAPPDITPVKLSLRLNDSGQCELWARIKNIGPVEYKDPLEWEVFKDGQWVGTWGTGNNDMYISPQNKKGDEVKRRLASPAALPIDLFGLHKWQVKLLPQGTEGGKVNNIMSETLQCKTLIAQPEPGKEFGSSADVGVMKGEPAQVIIQGGRLSYRLGEQVTFILPEGIDSLPYMECFDGRRWSRKKCSSGITLFQIGKEGESQYVLKVSQAGKYRLRLGTVVSKTLTFRGTPKTAPVLKEKETHRQCVTKITLNRNVFTAPAKVKLEVKTEPGAKVEYVLEKKTHGQYRRVKTLHSLSFNIDESGQYRVKATCAGSSLESVKAFEVKAARRTDGTKTRKAVIKHQANPAREIHR